MPRLNNVLVIPAVLGVFAAFDLVGHKDVSYFWPKLAVLLSISTACLLATRHRESWDTFFAAIAGLFTLCAVAMTAGDRARPNWWPFFLGFAAMATLFVFLVRNRRETLIPIGAIVGFRLVVFVVLHGINP
jgi:hypothetical protein